MSAAKKSIRAALVADPDLFALVGRRVFWSETDTATLPATPFLVLQQISAVPRYTLDGSPQVTNRYQVTIVAGSTDEAARVFARVVAVLQWFRDPSASIRQCRFEAMTAQRQQDADAVAWFADFMVTEDVIQ